MEGEIEGARESAHEFTSVVEKLKDTRWDSDVTGPHYRELNPDTQGGRYNDKRVEMAIAELTTTGDTIKAREILDMRIANLEFRISNLQERLNDLRASRATLDKK